MTEDLVCPYCGRANADPGETQDGMGFDGEYVVQCGSHWSGTIMRPGCGSRFRVRRTVSVEFEVLDGD